MSRRILVFSGIEVHESGILAGVEFDANTEARIPDSWAWQDVDSGTEVCGPSIGA